MSDNNTPTKEPVVVKQSRFLGLTKIQFLAVLLVILVVAVSTLGGLLAWQLNRNHQQALANQDAIAYICSTTGVLDSVVTDAANQIQTNLDNGTYDNLVKKGVIPQANVDAAKKTLVSYRHAHQILIQHNTKCKS